MRTLSTDWLIYSESGVPVWLVLIGLAGILWIAHACLKRELRGRTGRCVRLLPITLVAVFIPAALVVWRPVVTATQSEEHQAEVLALTDASQSMSLPLHPERTTAKLDVAAAWEPDACAGRNTAARTLREKLQAIRGAAAPLAAKLDAQCVELEQGLPAGSVAVALLGEYETLLKTARADVPAAAGGLAPLLSGSEAVGDVELRNAAGEALGVLEKSQVSLGAPRAAGAPLSAAALRGIVGPLAAFNAAAERLSPVLERLQEAADRKFCTDHKPALEKTLATAATRSRGELAAWARAALPAPAVAIASSGDPAQTDLYEQVTQALDARKDQVVSHCILFSDGAHNGAPGSPVVDRLKKEEIQFITVGCALPESRATALAICDCRLRRVLRAGKPANLRAEIKAAPGAALKLALSLHDQGDQALATLDTAATATANGELTPVTLTFKAPPEGAHILRLSVAGPSEAAAELGTVLIQVDCVENDPRLLLLGASPDWDTALLGAAAQREGCPLTQIFSAGETPKRGGLSRSIPNALLQWTRFRAVLLCAPAFKGFAAQDAKDLYDFVAEKGGTLLLVSETQAGYDPALAAAFGWSEPPRKVSGALRIAGGAAALPCLRLGADGAQSVRSFAALGQPAAAWRVPAQDIVLLETDQGEPVCSLGFYGRGKVLHWGLRGLYKMREYEKAAVVDRLLDDLIGELAAPVFPAADAAIAAYPRLPQQGQPCQLLIPAVSGKPPVAALKVDGAECAPASSAHGCQRFVATPAKLALAVQNGSETWSFPVHDNPGIEVLYAEFNENFLRRYARAAGGEYVPALQARQKLAALAPRTYLTKSSETWRPGRSPLLLAWVAMCAALHWILRKLAGLAI